MAQEQVLMLMFLQDAGGSMGEGRGGGDPTISTPLQLNDVSCY